MSREKVLKNHRLFRELLEELAKKSQDDFLEVYKSLSLKELLALVSEKITFEPPQKDVAIFFEMGPCSSFGFNVPENQVLLGYSRVKGKTYIGALYLYDISKGIKFLRTMSYIVTQND